MWGFWEGNMPSLQLLKPSSISVQVTTIYFVFLLSPINWGPSNFGQETQIFQSCTQKYLTYETDSL